jgi:SWI/SNF-related matrix-associated actin-dependent regulator of chromatin subfamily D
VASPLAEIIGVKEESRAGVMSAVWKWVKTVGAQDKDDVTKLKVMGGLEKVSRLSFHSLENKSG